MNVVRSLNRLLRLRGDDTLDFHSSASLLVGAAICASIYAAAAGFFQGGSSIGIAALKIPLIIFGSLLLCLPSLYIFTALAGVEISIREFAAAVAGFSGIVGLILLALMPVTWLFAVSTMSLGFVVMLHLFIWITALVFGRRIIVRRRSGAPGGSRCGPVLSDDDILTDWIVSAGDVDLPCASRPWHSSRRVAVQVSRGVRGESREERRCRTRS